MKQIIGGIMVGVTLAIGFLETIILVGMLLAIPLMLLWNYLMPEIFGLMEISLFQAFLINILTGILFGSKNSSSKGK